jgi:hypothetical protein
MTGRWPSIPREHDRILSMVALLGRHESKASGVTS